MSETDPSVQFFSGEKDIDLYAVLNVTTSAKPEDIRKSYRRLALLYHPDKHASSSVETRAEASIRFQQLGFAYAILGDDKRREKYDRTGSTDEGLELVAGEGGWEAYFEDLFERVTRGKLDEMKKEYQGSSEEIEDLKRAYIETDGSIDEIMNHIPHSTNEDEERFILLISKLIKKGKLPNSKTWEASVKDEKAKIVRKKQSEKEAVEAEELAKELGIWNEFYGNGQPGQRKGKGKSNADDGKEAEEDNSALQALILDRQKKRSGLLDSLVTKYAESDLKKGKNTKKGRKRKDDDTLEESGSIPPEIDDAEFAKLQEKLFGDKTTEEGTPLVKEGLNKRKKVKK